MTATIPKRINHRWLAQNKAKLDCCAKLSRDGQPNPNYAALAAEIEDAERQLANWNTFAAWMKREKGQILNQYPLRTRDGVYEPGQVFFSKTNGVVDYQAVGEAWEGYLQATGA